ncbi:MAG TPA: type II CAAX endopeptidase family protein [Kofleriaceae bacterium]|nr:type II CAAX endopeptidase family protein [Kofleriaceae bacterium]
MSEIPGPSSAGDRARDRPRLYRGPGAPLAVSIGVGAYALAVSTLLLLDLVGGGSWNAAALGELVAFGAVPVLVVHLHGGTRADLGLVAPPLLGMLGAAVAGTGTWLVAFRIAVPVVHATHAERSMHELSEQLLAGDVAVVLLTRALVPAVCEELVHRGLLLGALAPRLGRALAVVVVSVPFALLHLEPARMAASFSIGLVAGALAAWGRSIGPAITVHAVHNGVTLVVGLGLLPAVTRQLDLHPDRALAEAATLVGIGLFLAWIGRQRS